MEETSISRLAHLQKKMQGENSNLESQKTLTKHNKGALMNNNKT
jgi:hypothetical protein